MGASRLKSRDVFDQIEQGRLAPVQIIEHDDQRHWIGAALEELANGPRDLARRRHGFLFAQQHLDRGSHLGVGGHQLGGAGLPCSVSSNCLTIETTGQYVMPCP